MYGAFGYWGFKTQSSWVLKIFFGISLPVLIAVLWGTFLAPKATRPLSGTSFLILELLLYAAKTNDLVLLWRLDKVWM